ncbi:hypothetical protein F2P56_034939 [Juglans regia]|uniref:Cyclic nucleotide-gated ion channel 1-like n=1 Tax=Juglans regia TaxID=51240 RepID=A0A833TVF7_JUGRE|nr:hypothetical protein F2P56_034939 [Juglans regia]
MSRRLDSGGSGRRVRDEDVERQGPKNDGIGSKQKKIIKLAIGQVNQRLMKIISKTPWWFRLQYFHWDVAFLVVCVVAVAVDPLFFYLPVVDEDTKCITIDTTLEIIAICVRSFLDLVALGDLVARSIESIDDCYSRSDYVINILAILPVPQIVENSQHHYHPT